MHIVCCICCMFGNGILKIFLSVFGVWICGSTQVSTTFWTLGPRGGWFTLCALDSTGHTIIFFKFPSPHWDSSACVQRALVRMYALGFPSERWSPLGFSRCDAYRCALVRYEVLEGR